MKSVVTAFGHKQGSRVVLDNPDRYRFEVGQLKDGAQLVVSVEPHEPGKRKRTLKQNAFWHAEPFFKLAQAWGESVARAKLICMGEFWGWEPCKVTGHMLPVKAHTSDMTVEEGTTFLDWLIPWAAEEHNVEIRLPDEWERLAR
jgi:hypothetical protein